MARSSAPAAGSSRGIIEGTGASIDVADDGGVTLSSSDQTSIELARSRIEGLTRELVVGDILTGKVNRLASFGAFVELIPGKDGLVRNEGPGRHGRGTEGRPGNHRNGPGD